MGEAARRPARIALALLGASALIAGGASPAPRPVVFIHGIKGAELVDDRRGGERVWIGALEALGLSTPALALPLEWDGGIQRRDAIRATAPLARVRVLPYLLEEPVYGPFLAAARASGRPVYPFAYDWRRDNLETVAAFAELAARVRALHGTAPAVIAHSMGGLVALAALHAQPDAFASAAFVGVPFAGGIGFLADLHAGTRAGLNARILAPETLFSFPSVFALFPARSEGRLRAADGAAIDVDFHDARAWRELGLSVFADRAAPPALAAARFAHLERSLARARALRERLPARPVRYPPIRVVAGRAWPTLVTAVRDGPRSVRGWDFESAPRAPGDGRVAHADALPPAGIPYVEIPSGAEHAQLLNDPEVSALLLREL